VTLYASGSHILGASGAVFSTSVGAAFIPNSNFSISAPSGFADGETITITGPSGSFGTKPNGVAPYALYRPGQGFITTTDPLSRTSFTDANFPETGQSGPGGSPGLQSSTAAPGSSQSFQTILPGAAVITGTLTNGSANITSVVQVSGTNFASVDYGFGGLVVKDLSTNFIPDGTTVSSSQPNLGSNQITMTSEYTGTTETNVTINISYGPDQIACPRGYNSAQPQDQIFYFRGMNTFPWRSSNFNNQNNKFIRGFQTHSSTSSDVYFQSSGANNVVSRYVSDGTSTTLTQVNFSGAGWVWTANQWFAHLVMYHGNSSSGSTDGGIIYVADGVTQIGTVGTVPSAQAVPFWGAGSSNVGLWEYNDIACRPDSPLANDTCYTDIYYLDDSACCILISNGTTGYEIQIPTTSWTDTAVTFVMRRAYLDALLGAGSLNGDSLIVQKSTYAQTNCGTFTAAA
jgi:hypothetical protein